MGRVPTSNSNQASSFHRNAQPLAFLPTSTPDSILPNYPHLELRSRGLHRRPPLPLPLRPPLSPSPPPPDRPRAADSFQRLSAATVMVIPPPVRPPRIINYLKPYMLRMHFSNKYVNAQVIHTPTATVAASASSQERLLRPSMESTRDVAAAAKIGKILGERLLLKGIPAD